MKECPKCHRKISNASKFCPRCGSELTPVKSDTTIIPSVSSVIQKPGEDSKSLTTNNRAENALAFVYIAQYARTNGPEEAGVLVDDCKQHFEGIYHLLNQGSVQEKIWPNFPKLRGYITTTEGSRRAVLIIQQRLNQNKNTLVNMLDSLPPRFLHFFREEVMKGEDFSGARNINQSVLTFTDVKPSVHLCLLTDEKVRKLLDNMMRALIQHGLAVAAHTYAASHQGRVDDLVYSFAPEVASFFDEYLISTRKFAVGPLFDEGLEAKHRLYHQLSDGIISGKNYLDKAALDQLRMIRGNLRADLIRVFNNLFYLKAVTVDPSRVFIEKTKVFQDVVRQEFFSPLVDQLLSPFTDKKLEIAGPSVLVVDANNDTKFTRAKEIDSLFGELGDGKVYI